MKPDFFCVPGLFLVFVAFSSTLGCDPNTGPAGVTRCFLGTPYYSRYQCGTCLTDVYIRQRSRGEHECREPTATYCYYQCMLEKHDLDRGPVSDDCLCNPNVELPQPPVILPPSCYSPGGTDCAWYSQCLHRMFPCTGQAEYAISYGEKFCNLYTHTELQFSPEALQWINAARKCLQVALVSVLHLCQVRPTCEEIKTKAFDSHVPCYVAPYEGFSVCTLPVMDWLRIFWTIKGSFVSSAFLETVKASVLTAANCSSILADRLGEYLYSIPVWLWEKTIKTIIEKRAADDTLSDDELAHTVILHVSSSLGWDQESTMSWYAFAANTNDGGNFMITPSTDQPGRQLIIQLFVVDRVDIGLLEEADATGRRRLDQTISQLSDVIRQGLRGTAGDFRFGVMSLRQCDTGANVISGCSNGTLVASGPSLDVLINDFPSSTGTIRAPESIIYWLLAAVAFLSPLPLH